jgi:hypothetical protein
MTDPSNELPKIRLRRMTAAEYERWICSAKAGNRILKRGVRARENFSVLSRA